MASQNTPGKRCSCSEGRVGTPQHKGTEPSLNTAGSMMRAGPMVMVAAVVVITRPKKNNKQGQLSDDDGGSSGYNNMPDKNK